MRIIIRAKNQYAGIGYIKSRVIETENEYTAKEFIDKELELNKIGDDKWHKIEQDFDCSSTYLTDGICIMWYELLN